MESLDEKRITRLSRECVRCSATDLGEAAVFRGGEVACRTWRCSSSNDVFKVNQYFPALFGQRRKHAVIALNLRLGQHLR